MAAPGPPTATPTATAGALLVAQQYRWGVAAGVGPAGVAAHTGQGLLHPTPGLSYGWWLVLVVAVYAALVAWGALARSRRALIGSLRAEADQAQRVAAARAHERTMIARGVHDVLAHRLSPLVTYAGALEFRPDSAPALRARARTCGAVV